MNSITVKVIILLSAISAYSMSRHKLSKLVSSIFSALSPHDIAMSSVAIENSVVINTQNGRIRGYLDKTLLKKRDFFSFRGIPFAEAPVGQRRFKAPEPIKPWNDILDASKFSNVCVQVSQQTNEIAGDDDCLFLNVFTPDVAPREKLPVVVFFHGGGYNTGSASGKKPDILLDENIVLVTIQYRLGPLGFLSLDHPEYSGNQGLKDQMLALEWINQNVESFGGDKSNITLWGHSAGASSVNLFVLLPQAKGLFQRAILSGGAIYNQFAYLTDRLIQKKALQKTLSKLWNVDKEAVDEAKIIEWLTNTNSAEIVKTLQSSIYVPGLSCKRFDPLWAPVIEGENAVRPFLTQKPDVYFDQPSDVDVLIGYSTGESMLFLGAELNDPSLLKPFNDNFEVQSPLAGRNIEKCTEEQRAIRKFYFGEKDVNDGTLSEYVELLSDIFFKYGIYWTAVQQAQRSSGKTYFYEFDVITDLNFSRKANKADARGLRGVAHAEDSAYLFKSSWIPEERYLHLSADEIRSIEIARSFFVNFARFGTPTPLEEPSKLEAFSNGAQNYVTIRKDGLVLGVRPQEKVFRFWTELLEKYNGVTNK